MIDIEKMCFQCMSTTQNGVCTVCGFNNLKYRHPSHWLKPKTLLNGKYVIGKVLGEGGFGITYTGFDLNKNVRVAIKEYFPSGFVSRDIANTDTLTVFSGSKADFFNKGRRRFLDEAKTLAKFNHLDGIVSVLDFFNENGTAYLVMEFIDGDTLTGFLKRHGGRIEMSVILDMFKPLMYSLMQVHGAKIIHRDISPSNIMISTDGKVTLLDFGAAKYISDYGNKSLSIQLKPGYAPEEQYRTHGQQGPWTDVYALCATLYRCITGVVPLEALERMQNDTLVPPSQLGVGITPMQEQALMSGLAVSHKNRFQNVGALYRAFYESNASKGSRPPQVPPGQPHGPIQGQVPPGQPHGPIQPQVLPGQAHGPIQGQVPPGQPHGPIQPQVPPGQPHGPIQGQVPPGQAHGPIQPQVPPGQPHGPIQGQVPPGQPHRPPQSRDYDSQSRQSVSDNSENVSTGAIIGIVGGILAFFVVIGLAVTLASGGSGHDVKYTSSPTYSYTQAPTYRATKSPTKAPAPVFNHVSASSIRNPDFSTGSKITYPISNINDGIYSTAWGNNSDIDPFPQITLSSTRRQHVTGIRIANGYFKSPEVYTKNCRITKIRISHEYGSEIAYLNGSSYGKMQTVELSEPVDVSYITIEVMEYIDGTTFSDVHISELEVY